jgi:hypothetical protein
LFVADCFASDSGVFVDNPYDRARYRGTRGVAHDAGYFAGARLRQQTRSCTSTDRNGKRGKMDGFTKKLSGNHYRFLPAQRCARAFA